MPKKRSGIITIVAFAASILMAGYAVFSIVSSNIKINEYQQQYNELVIQTAAVEDSNAEISRYLEEGADMDEYIEDMARDKLDYARPDERVYYVVPDSGRS
ncbi:MAG: septum formation initiator family protein [Oscillospiraceae bacterium]